MDSIPPETHQRKYYRFHGVDLRRLTDEQQRQEADDIAAEICAGWPDEVREAFSLWQDAEYCAKAIYDSHGSEATHPAVKAAGRAATAAMERYLAVKAAAITASGYREGIPVALDWFTLCPQAVSNGGREDL